jgi:hypothetical protein
MLTNSKLMAKSSESGHEAYALCGENRMSVFHAVAASAVQKRST